jgi:hypothetical protein
VIADADRAISVPSCDGTDKSSGSRPRRSVALQIFLQNVVLFVEGRASSRPHRLMAVASSVGRPHVKPTAESYRAHDLPGRTDEYCSPDAGPATTIPRL